MRGKIVTKQEEKKIINAYLLGMNQNECAKKFDRDQSLIRNVLIRNSVPIRTFSSNFGITLEIEKEIVEMYRKGYTAYQCADKFNTTQSTVMRIFKRNNFNTRGCLGGKRLLKINEEYFDNIDSKDKAYWLGWIYSDGYISLKGFGLTVSSADSYILEILKDLIEYEGKLLIKKPRGNIKECKSIIVTSKKLKRALELLGLKRNKSLTLKFPNYIKPDLMNHFIRGLIDGDGCVCIDKKNRTTVQYTGTYDMCLNVQKEFEKKGIKSNKIAYNGKVCAIAYSHKDSLIKIYNFIYENCESLVLKRKKEKLEKGLLSNKIKFNE